MKKVLLPTNFSKKARNAARYAMQLFREDQPKFHLLNAYDLPAWSTVVQISALQGGIGVKAKKSLIEDQHRFTKEVSIYGASFTTATEFGKASRVILGYANRHQVDYVVMGTQGGNNYRKFFSGSNTQEVLRKAQCPIIAIPERARYQTPKNILFIPDPNATINTERLGPLVEITEKFDSQIIVLNLINRFSVGKTEQHLKDLKKQLGDSFHSFHLLSEHNIEEGLDKFLDNNDVDLLVLQGKNNFLNNMFRSWNSRKSPSFSKRPLLAIRN
ncbi:universal stress protein [Flavilitoribacter nigricans]|uniref:UspA domain-containing protein n=1 Tax=Flavilitoribacter nigricans (strain ATCC 23147 / DSM 23189 / NBRC 102662 / NCIMB 1420 / SS-2) TaxID=1122177 RepID=A0A2D0N1Y9_FLAN2|nr:universal stress protein [Flavilitoribacter nigricans]PHN02467.1 hypothetical protein CRP01_32310 [Flavilitoribacter nigricans DSM 23189 = NBRC 102662]